MSNFMRDDVSLREIARCVELSAQLLVEREIDVNLLISRTIEWSNCRARNSASRAHLIRKQHERGFAILPAVFSKHIGPNIFRFPEHHRDELFQLFLFSILGA